MKKFLLLGVLFVSAMPLLATKAVTVQPVQRPTTPGTASAVKTNAVVTKPQTVAPVLQPVTTATVQRPATLPSNTTAFGGTMGKTSAGGSYTPSYKNAKQLGSSSTSSAASLGKGEEGLGTKDAQAAAKAALAAQEKPKADKPDLASVLQAVQAGKGVDKKTLENKNQAAAMYNKSHK